MSSGVLAENMSEEPAYRLSGVGGVTENVFKKVSEVVYQNYVH